MKHDLKLNSEFYQDVLNRRKTFEVRINDKNFQVRDILTLREFIPCLNCNGTGRVEDHTDFVDCIVCNESHGEYTGNECYASIEYILQGGQFGIAKEYCVMSIYVYSYLCVKE